MIIHDITKPLTYIINEILKIFKYFFNLMDSIVFNGFSLLDFCITFLVFSAIIPVLISVIDTINHKNGETRKSKEKERRKKEKEGSA